MKKKYVKNTEAGFTLIEIIAVLIILGILAAVAVPRFLDMQTDAQTRAVEGALAAGASNASLAFSKFLLTNGNQPTSITGNAWTGTGTSVAIETNLGDFTATYSYTAPDVTVNITASTLNWFAGSAAVKTKTFRIG